MLLQNPESVPVYPHADRPFFICCVSVCPLFTACEDRPKWSGIAPGPEFTRKGSTPFPYDVSACLYPHGGSTKLLAELWKKQVYILGDRPFIPSLGEFVLCADRPAFASYGFAYFGYRMRGSTCQDYRYPPPPSLPRMRGDNPTQRVRYHRSVYPHADRPFDEWRG